MRVVVVVFLLAAASVHAGEVPDPGPAVCDSCAARHKALKRLQDTRLPSPEPVPQETTGAGDTKTDKED